MKVKSSGLTFSELHRLLKHLRRGGTRKGACGWAGITFSELEQRFVKDDKFATAVEKNESFGLARDERRLEERVGRGDGQALLFRMKTVYGYAYGKGPGKAGAGREEDEKSEAFGKVREEIDNLSQEERRATVKAYREAASC